MKCHISQSTVDSILAPRPAASGLILSAPNLFKIRCCQDLSTPNCLESEWTSNTSSTIKSQARTTKKTQGLNIFHQRSERPV